MSVEALEQIGHSAGYWSREEVVRMDNLACARMAAVHPQFLNAEIRASIGLMKRKIANPKYVRPSADEILSQLFGVAFDNPPSELAPIEERRLSVETAKAIRAAVAARHGLSLTDLDSDCRRKAIVTARHEAWYLICRDTILSYPRIARMSGGKNHTSVFYGVRKHADRNGLPRVREPNLAEAHP
jgi:hypothetical protein